MEYDSDDFGDSDTELDLSQLGDAEVTLAGLITLLSSHMAIASKALCKRSAPRHGEHGASR